MGRQVGEALDCCCSSVWGPWTPYHQAPLNLGSCRQDRGSRPILRQEKFENPCFILNFSFILNFHTVHVCEFHEKVCKCIHKQSLVVYGLGVPIQVSSLSSFSLPLQVSPCWMGVCVHAHMHTRMCTQKLL